MHLSPWQQSFPTCYTVPLLASVPTWDVLHTSIWFTSGVQAVLSSSLTQALVVCSCLRVVYTHHLHSMMLLYSSLEHAIVCVYYIHATLCVLCVNTTLWGPYISYWIPVLDWIVVEPSRSSINDGADSNAFWLWRSSSLTTLCCN